MFPVLRDDGSVAVPMRAEADDGTIGDGIVVLRPGDDGYEAARRDAEKAAQDERFAGRADDVTATPPEKEGDR